jgi:hypothetical protein
VVFARGGSAVQRGRGELDQQLFVTLTPLVDRFRSATLEEPP